MTGQEQTATPAATQPPIPENMLCALGAEAQQSICHFISLCRDLSEMVKAESDVIMKTGTGITYGNFYRKLEMMETFEVAAKQVFDVVMHEAPDNVWLRLYLASEVNTLRHAFKINTALHMDDMQRRAKKLQALKDGIIETSQSGNGDAACH